MYVYIYIYIERERERDVYRYVCNTHPNSLVVGPREGELVDAGLGLADGHIIELF